MTDKPRRPEDAQRARIAALLQLYPDLPRDVLETVDFFLMSTPRYRRVTPRTDDEPGAVMTVFVIWSIEHDAWWKPDACGYTRVVEEAGVYAETAARKILAKANYPPGTFHECLIPVECVLRSPRTGAAQ